jgi:hypothetical protein
MPKPLRVAGEVDSWCTKCRLVLNHRIVSMKAGKAHQVECLTCRTTHLWRPNAPGDRVAPGEASGASSGGDRPRTASAATKAPRATHAAQAAHARLEQQWEKAIVGRAVTEFKAYNIGASFAEGDLVRHKKFGDGVVTRVIDAGKVEVLFRDEAKTLAQGMV